MSHTQDMHSWKGNERKGALNCKQCWDISLDLSTCFVQKGLGINQMASDRYKYIFLFSGITALVL